MSCYYCLWCLCSPPWEWWSKDHIYLTMWYVRVVKHWPLRITVKAKPLMMKLKSNSLTGSRQQECYNKLNWGTRSPSPLPKGDVVCDTLIQKETSENQQLLWITMMHTNQNTVFEQHNVTFYKEIDVIWSMQTNNLPNFNVILKTLMKFLTSWYITATQRIILVCRSRFL